MPLTHWEERLRQRFTELRRERTATVGARPIFALEHGLTPEEVMQLSADVRAAVALSPPDWRASLAWVVYAAELGYEYSGDEYWQSFEDRTPGWRLFGDRQKLRTCYVKFQAAYGGAKPSGPWAAHFSIICWPITHAILPRDLQRQLAQILYELRNSFTAELLETPERLGEVIRGRSWSASSRFLQLVEEPKLVGQIAAALLLQGQFGTSGLIDQPTLQRISGDLDKERLSREWLRSARRVAQERACVRGLMPGWRGADEHSIARTSLEKARAEVAALGIEPSLVLRPQLKGDGQWELVLEVPDLSHLLIRFPQTREVLTGSRCVVTGSAGRPLPRGGCLHGVQSVRLSSWPGYSEVLLKFDIKNPQLEYLLRTECLLRPGPLWLFRVASDNVAYELRGQRVRPGRRYIALRASSPFVFGRHLKPIGVDCSGVHAAVIDLPQTVDREWEEALRQMGLGLAKTIEAWPAGLDALTWDGEGHGEWYVAERPCLAIRVDHEVDALFALLDNEHTLVVDVSIAKAGEPVFLEIPQLAVGHHSLRLSARAKPSAETEPVGELDLVMRVRESPAWLGVSPHGPLVVEVEPTSPSLEQLWEGRVDVAVRGPADRSLKCVATLTEKAAAPLGAAPKVTHSVSLPITPDAWRTYFDTHVRRSDVMSRAYDTADACVIQFSSDDLGAFAIRCEREFRPLRWVVHRSGQRHSARVIDDSGDPSPLQVVHIAFETPAVEETLGGGPVYDVPSVGGLYLARRNEDTAAVIVPPSNHGLSFKDLACVPRIEARGRTVDDVLRLVALVQTWSKARVPGNILALRRHRDVLRALTREIFRIVGGDAWARAEAAAEANPDSFDELKRTVSRKVEERNLSAGLSLSHQDLAHKPTAQRVKRLAESIIGFRLIPQLSDVLPLDEDDLMSTLIAAGNLTFRRRPANEQDAVWLSELALRLASAAASVEEWAGPTLRPGLAKLMEIPTIARAARFLVLAIDRHVSAPVTQEAAYARWEWT